MPRYVRDTGILMQLLKIFVVTCLMLVRLSVAASALTASDLNQACFEKDGQAGDVHCDSYVRGLLDGISVGQAIQLRKAAEFCPPKGGITTEKGRSIIEAHFRRHAEQLPDEAGLSAMLAILTAFPCKPPSR